MSTNFNYQRTPPKGEVKKPTSTPYTREPPKPVVERPVHQGVIVGKGDIPGFGSWSLDEEGVFCISGKGEMPDYGNENTRPWFLLREKISTIWLSDEVTSIGSGAFRDCTGLREIWMPKGLTSIGKQAFQGCSNLEKFSPHEGITIIGDWAFGGCTSLQDIYIPNSVTIVGDSAFRDCTSLIEVAIPVDGILNISSVYPQFGKKMALFPLEMESACSVGRCAFLGCSNLRWVNVSNRVTSIGTYAFYRCNGLRKVTMPARFKCLRFKSKYGIPKSIVTFI